MAEKTKKNYKDIVLALRNGHCTSFAEPVKRWPISAFKNHRAVKNFLLVPQVALEWKLVEEIVVKQPFQTLTENWKGKIGSAAGTHHDQ